MTTPHRRAPVASVAGTLAAVLALAAGGTAALASNGHSHSRPKHKPRHRRHRRDHRLRGSRGATATPIKHVIVIIGENHTFDNVFATYQPPPGEHVMNLLSEGIVTASGAPGPNAAKAMQRTATDTSAQGYPFTDQSTDQGALDMGFYNMAAGDEPTLQFLARHYAMSDNYHQAVMGGTGANHIMLGTGDAAYYQDANGNPTAPPSGEIENPNAQPGTNNFYTQDGYGKSGTTDGGSYSNCSEHSAPGVKGVFDYLGTLPAVSFLKPGDDDGHAGYSTMAAFEQFATHVITEIQNNPKLWKNTAIFVTMDEGGGYYDSGYVQPVSFFGDGSRIPMIVVSPYTKPGYISHTYTDHVSVLKFIERNWKLSALSSRSLDNLPDPKSHRSDPYVPTNRPAIGDMFDYFDFRHPQAASAAAVPRARRVQAHGKPVFVPDLLR